MKASLKIFVLGATGYLGSKIAKKCLESGYSVTCAKRSTSDTSRLQNVDVSWVDTDKEDIEAVFRKEAFQCVINAMGNYGRANDSQSDVIKANLTAPLEYLEMASKYLVKTFITMGTGLPDELNLYSFSKGELNRFGEFYSKKTGINFCSLKLEMFYGEDEPANRFLPGVIRKMISAEPVDSTLGTQKRDIIYVDDVVKAVLAVVEMPKEGFNEIPVGTGIAPSISEVLDYIWEKTGRKSIINKGAVKMRDNEPDCVADTSVIEKFCKWKPLFWKTGIEKMIEEISKGE